MNLPKIKHSCCSPYFKVGDNVTKFLGDIPDEIEERVEALWQLYGY
jgi:hypothetical protein